MSVRDIIYAIDQNSGVAIAFLAAVPILASMMGAVHGAGNGARSPWRYFYSVLVYAACVPGIFAATIAGYSLFFRNADMLSASLVAFVLPIISMIVTLAVIKRAVNLDDIPGFERIEGLMLMLFCSFVLALIVQRTGIWLVFRGSFVWFIGLIVVIFAIIKLSSNLVIGKSRGPNS